MNAFKYILFSWMDEYHEYDYMATLIQRMCRIYNTRVFDSYCLCCLFCHFQIRLSFYKGKEKN